MILDCKTGVDHIMPHISIFDHGSSTSGKTPNHGFFTFTFTQAMCQNVHSKWQQRQNSTSERYDVTVGVSDIREFIGVLRFSLGLFSATNQKYITEVELKMQPVDVIVQPVIALSAVTVFRPIIELIQAHLPYTAIPNETLYPLGWNFNNGNLPLLHVNSSTIRVFLLNHLPGTYILSIFSCCCVLEPSKCCSDLSGLSAIMCLRQSSKWKIVREHENQKHGWCWIY